MYVALNGTLTAGRTPWPDFARLAHKVGFPGVDVDITRAMAAGLEPSRALLDELRLKPAVVGLPVDFRQDEAKFEQSFTGLDEAAKFSAALACPRMTTWIMSSSELPKAEQRKIFLGRFRRCAEVLARHNLRLGFEFLGPLHLRKRFTHEFIWRMDEMLEFAHDCGPNCGVLLDFWHWHHAGGTLADIETAGRAGIVHVQAADAPNLPPDQIVDNERLMPGEGIVDFDGLFRTLKKIGYRDGVSPEVFGRGLKDMVPEEGARMGLETTERAMRKAGVL